MNSETAQSLNFKNSTTINTPGIKKSKKNFYKNCFSENTPKSTKAIKKVVISKSKKQNLIDVNDSFKKTGVYKFLTPYKQKIENRNQRKKNILKKDNDLNYQKINLEISLESLNNSLEYKKNLKRLSTTSISSINLSIEETFLEDFKRNLPRVQNPQIQDLCFISISGETLTKILIEQNFTEKYILIDCRYPYEYNGGHIKNAVNVYQFDSIDEIFFSKNVIEGERKTPILYCEFSQKRSVAMAEEIRRRDRKHNVYPQLYYREMYLLDRGYRQFFKDGFLAFCVPPEYISMNDERFDLELGKYINCNKKKPIATTICHSENSSISSESLQKQI